MNESGQPHPGTVFSALLAIGIVTLGICYTNTVIDHGREIDGIKKDVRYHQWYSKKEAVAMYTLTLKTDGVSTVSFGNSDNDIQVHVYYGYNTKKILDKINLYQDYITHNKDINYVPDYNIVFVQQTKQEYIQSLRVKYLDLIKNKDRDEKVIAEIFAKITELGLSLKEFLQLKGITT